MFPPQVILLPEGLIEFIPEVGTLIGEINDVLAGMDEAAADAPARNTNAALVAKLTEPSRECFLYLPDFIQQQLLLDRDPHGNVQVAKIETEKLLSATVRAELLKRFHSNLVDQIFRPQYHAFGYEGRAGPPTFFDASYCYALGATCTTLLACGETGMIASVKNLRAPVKEWECGGVPVTALCVLERRKGKNKPVIEKALVNLAGKPFQLWKKLREKVAVNDFYRIPGPIQFSEECPCGKEIPITLDLELGGRFEYAEKHVLGVPLSGGPPTKTSLDGGQSFTIDWPERGGRFQNFGARPRSELQEWRGKDEYASAGLVGRAVVGAVSTQCATKKDAEYIGKLFPKTYGKPLVGRY